MQAEHPLHPLTQVRILGIVLILAVCLAGAAGTVHPVFANIHQTGSIFTVNDPADPGGAVCQIAACSLRAAITAANAGSLPGGYIIAFELSYPAQITLNGSLPEVTGTIDMLGPGRTALTISGGGLVRIFSIHSGANLTLSGMTLRQGWNGVEGGGAILNAGSLEVNNVTLADNLAGGGDGGGLLNLPGGVVQIAGANFLNNDGFHDGAIANYGSITISSSVFSGNRARVAGAIDNYGSSTLTITGSAFTDNIAKISSGGAIVNAGTLVIANSTFYQNGSPTGADIVSGNTLYVTNSTFYGAIMPSFNSIAGGGVGSTITLRNNIFAAGSGVDNCAPQPGGVFSVDSSNLSTDATCPGATLVTLAQLNLSPLAEVAGMPVLVLLPGSAAIEAGDNTICAAAVGAPSYGAGGQDQRGVHRPVGVHCDVGSIEFVPPVLSLPLILR